MTGRRRVTSPEAVWALAGCWAVCGLGGVLLSIGGEPSPPVAVAVMTVLVHWFRRRQDRVAGVFAGTVVVLGAVALPRPVVGRGVADPLAIGLGASVAVVFTAITGTRAVRAGRRNV
ncbi:hypothetical protein [Streptomyces sp. WMMC940]|uniref:hypothetical protein n=1 Tax=Streptomyces sp. WMMC940 TaxID=3015153 RepID=UPI0022B61646|nr:hypothetical protein [Streptomyces sp. WMMC940]MCZ7459031.1 hypothetical protein [Streptomyces sp. WMMC940]